MKTVVIFDELEADLRFFVFNGDIKHLDRVYINLLNKCVTDDEISQHENNINELAEIVYEENGNLKVNFLTEFPVDEVKNGAQVITAGFFP